MRAFGEMVALLAAADRGADALDLEAFWNDLMARTPLELFCAYPLGVFERAGGGDALKSVCDAHSHVLPIEGAVHAQPAPALHASAGAPDAHAHGADAQAAHGRSVQHAIRRHVLVVDDDPKLADTLARWLRSAGHRVEIASDGASAIAEVVRSRPEIVLLDIAMPKIDGYEVARRLRALPALHSCVLVALTGMAEPDDVARAQARRLRPPHGEAAGPPPARGAAEERPLALGSRSRESGSSPRGGARRRPSSGRCAARSALPPRSPAPPRALVLHETFCEWRTLRVPAEQSDGAHARLLLRVREVTHASGNAAEWDRADGELRAYDRDWLACHREVRGDPQPGGPLAVCLARRPYTVVGATAEAVARGECELELHGALPQRDAVAACLAARGRREAPIPRWGYERLGPRFTGPWFALTALYSERDVANVVVSEGDRGRGRDRAAGRALRGRGADLSRPSLQRSAVSMSRRISGRISRSSSRRPSL